MDCNNCRDAKSPPSVPYIVHESAQARMERTLGRLWVTIVLLIVLLVGTNLAWIVYESQFEDVHIEAEQDGNGVNMVGGGDVTYGAESEDTVPNP